MAVFEVSVTLTTSAEELFELLSRPASAVDLTPPGTTMTLVLAPEVVQVGSRVEFDLDGMGPTQRLVHEIIECTPPSKITARQERGPFASFVHEALLQSNGDVEVKLTDRIEFEPPSGLLGFLLTETRVRSMLEEGYAYRHAELVKIFSA